MCVWGWGWGGEQLEGVSAISSPVNAQFHSHLEISSVVIKRISDAYGERY